MKILFLLFFMCLLNLHLLHGQSKWTHGVSASLGLSGEQLHKESDIPYPLVGTLVVSNEKKLRPAVGMGYWSSLRLNKRESISTGLKYTFLQHFNKLKTTIYDQQGELSTYEQWDEKLSIHQIQIPLQAQFYFRVEKTIKPYISIGGNFAYNIITTESKQQFLVFGLGNHETNTLFKEKYPFGQRLNTLNRFNISPIYGLGIQFKSFLIELNYIQSVFVSGYKKTKNQISCFGCEPISPKKVDSIMMSIKYFFD